MWRVGGVLLLWAAGGIAAVAEPLRLAANAWPPYTDQRLPHGGLASDLVRSAFQRAGYNTVQSELPWARVLRGLRTGRYDVAVSAWYSEERSKFADFSQPYLINQVRLVQRRGRSIRFGQLADLYPYRIAVARGYAYSPEFENDSRLSKVVVLDFAAGARMVQIQRLDLAVEDELVARYLFKGELASISGDLEFLPRPLSESGLHILVSHQHPEHRQIVEAFDQAITEMHRDGSYARIFRQHGYPVQQCGTRQPC
jgi:polar amino acid transport system substrate-binding protein